MNKNIKQHSIIQVNEHISNTNHIGLIMQVDEVKTWGVRAYLRMPDGILFVTRLDTVAFNYIGEPKIVPAP